MTVSSDFFRCVGAPLKNTPDFGVQRIFSKYYRKRTPTGIIPNRWTKEPNFAVVCLIHLLTQRSRNLALKTRRGLVILIFTRRRVSAYFFFVHWWKTKLPAPCAFLRVGPGQNSQILFISVEQLSLNVADDSAKTLLILRNMGDALDDCRLRFVQKCRRPPQNTPDLGGPKKTKINFENFTGM